MSENNLMHYAPKNVIGHFYIYGQVGESSNYIQLIEALRNAQEGDEIHIHIDSCGGYLYTAVSIIHAIWATNGHVVTHADGECSSAGSLLLFSGHSIIVNPLAHVMLHDGAYGNHDKMSTMKITADAAHKHLNEVYRTVYGPFFTDDEMGEILKGVDFYMMADEVLARIEQAIQNQREQEDVLVGESIEEKLEGLILLDPDEVPEDLVCPQCGRKARSEDSYLRNHGISCRG